MGRVIKTLGTLAGAGVATAAYGGLIERNAFTLRRFDVPVLAPGSEPLRVLHVSDLHITAGQHRKQRWIAELAQLEPDLVVNTGDTISGADAIPAILSALRPLARFPAVFVPGNNDYYQPRPRTPLGYFRPEPMTPRPADMPWPELAALLVEQGWTDLTHAKHSVDVAGVRIALAGLDDPHLKKARYDRIAGPADPSAAVRIGVMHSPEPALLDRFAGDGYNLTLAGHTHGGQIRIPFGPAIVTNSGIDVHRARWLHRWDEPSMSARAKSLGPMWFHVCAGLGTNPYMPIRFCCRPEASLLTLIARR
jgi:predicted MPP superfamily phosphohydrolase